MSRKVRYSIRAFVSYIRLFIGFIISKGTKRATGIQLISLGADLVSERNGRIVLENLNQIERGSLVHAVGGNIQLQGVFINRNCNIVSMESIRIMENVTIGPNVCIYDHDHNIYKNKKDDPDYITLPIIIEENVWIGANVTILKGVTIGKNSAVAAGASVIKDVPENSIVGGVPARIIKEKFDKYKHDYNEL